MFLLKIFMGLTENLRESIFSQSKFFEVKQILIECGLTRKEVYILENAIMKHNAFEQICFADESLQALVASEISDLLSKELSISSEETFSVLKDILQCIIWYNFLNDKDYSKLDNKCLMIMSEQGDDNASLEFAVRNFDGKIPNMPIEKQYETSIRIFEKLAEAGNLDALYYCGMSYFFGRGYPKDDIQALALFKKAAEAGNGHALSRLGFLYYTGYKKLDIPIDKSIAFMYFSAAKETGLVEGYKNCAYFYKYEDEYYNIPKAIENYEIVANAGDPNAQENIGAIYEAFDVDVKYRDYEKARFWYEKAAEQGEKVAAFNLANLYKNGSLGVEDNIEKAIYYYSISSEKGYKAAQFELAFIYDSNDKFRDYSKAAYWYEEGAKQGHSNSCNNLGVLYCDGKIGKTNTEENLKKAAYWFYKGAEAGSQQAKKNIEICKSKLTKYYYDIAMSGCGNYNPDISTSLPLANSQINKSSEIICPVCHSTQITAKTKGFSIGKAVVGSVLFGPLGLVGGASGSSKMRLACMKCGYEWTPNSIASKLWGK